MMLRRATVFAAGLTVATSFALGGAGGASATVPALKIRPGATWTIVANGGGCQLDVFAANYTFTSPDPQYHGDAGTWSGGGSTIKMKWTAGDNTGLTFKGTFTTTPVKEYVGSFGGLGGGFTGALLKGAVPGC
jgi:hypothetical protein